MAEPRGPDGDAGQAAATSASAERPVNHGPTMGRLTLRDRSGVLRCIGPPREQVGVCGLLSRLPSGRGSDVHRTRIRAVATGVVFDLERLGATLHHDEPGPVRSTATGSGVTTIHGLAAGDSVVLDLQLRESSEDPDLLVADPAVVQHDPDVEAQVVAGANGELAVECFSLRFGWRLFGWRLRSTPGLCRGGERRAPQRQERGTAHDLVNIPPSSCTSVRAASVGECPAAGPALPPTQKRPGPRQRPRGHPQHGGLAQASAFKQ